MSSSRSKTTSSIGFLTVREHGELGLLGGYLVINALGRPLEFHCTMPVKPNRAQEILYGNTLRPFLYGEQIGQTLVSKSKSAPVLICTDVEPALATRDFCECPMVLVVGRSEATGEAVGPTSSSSRLRSFQLAGHELAVDAAHERDRQQIMEKWPQLDAHLDLSEPFGRIREALEEAQKNAK